LLTVQILIAYDMDSKDMCPAQDLT